MEPKLIAVDFADLLHRAADLVHCARFPFATDPDKPDYPARLWAELRGHVARALALIPPDSEIELTDCPPAQWRDLRRLRHAIEDLATLYSLSEPSGELSFPVPDGNWRAIQRAYFPFAEYAAPRLASDEEASDEVKATVSAERSERLTVNERMIARIQKDSEARGWTTRQWAFALKCSPSTVFDSPTWKNLEELREVAKAERTIKRAKRGRRGN